MFILQKTIKLVILLIKKCFTGKQANENLKKRPKRWPSLESCRRGCRYRQELVHRLSKNSNRKRCSYIKQLIAY